MFLVTEDCNLIDITDKYIRTEPEEEPAPEITENETETSAESINDETFEENIASVDEEIEDIEELAYKIQEENEKDEENDTSGFFMEI